MSTYTPEQIVTLTSGRTWKVARVFRSEDGHTVVVGLVDPENPNHGTAFRAEVLDALIVTPPRVRLVELMKDDVDSAVGLGEFPDAWLTGVAERLVDAGWKR